MDNVSEASASPMAPPQAMPARRKGYSVMAYPKVKANATARATVGQLPHPSAVPSAMPATSPMVHPVKQCSVAMSAVRLSETAS